MNSNEIDKLTTQFYNTISFKNSLVPDIYTLHTLFNGAGLMINNSLEQSVLYTAESFVKDLESQIAIDNKLQFMQREIYAKTDMFGKVAQRLSVYEYSFTGYEPEQMPRGINFIQYIKIDDNWHITSMVWHDENENYRIPEEYLVNIKNKKARTRTAHY